MSIPSYQSGLSRFSMDDDSGCESQDAEDTPLMKHAMSGKKIPCSYSPSPRMNEKRSNESVKTDALVCLVDLFGAKEKRKGNLGVDTTRKDIGDILDMVIVDGAKPWSDLHLYASHHMLKRNIMIFPCHSRIVGGITPGKNLSVLFSDLRLNDGPRYFGEDFDVEALCASFSRLSIAEMPTHDVYASNVLVFDDPPPSVGFFTPYHVATVSNVVEVMVIGAGTSTA
ncbi:hypothetical protein D1007_12194 [Hordeum vulgare]|nr:hypothetical protein D1007_12194 [Hordeum vulgare]